MSHAIYTDHDRAGLALMEASDALSSAVDRGEVDSVRSAELLAQLGTAHALLAIYDRLEHLAAAAEDPPSYPQLVQIAEAVTALAERETFGQRLAKWVRR